MSDTQAKWLLRIMVMIYLLLGSAYAVFTPAWQAPDEPAHYNYVKYVAEQGTLPELRPGDFPSDYMEEIKRLRFPASMSIESIRYESHQPPVYYVLAAAVYRLTYNLSGLPMPLALRLFSVGLGAVALVAAYHLVRRIRPQEPILALGAVAFAAVLPMHLTMTAAVNNDVLSDVMLNVIVCIVVGMGTRDWSRRRSVALGAWLGIAFLTKMQSYVAFAVVLAALAWETWMARRRGLPGDEHHAVMGWKRAGGYLAIMLGTALLVASPWLLRNAALYGPGDLLALRRHDLVVAGQLTTAQFVGRHGWRALIQAMLLTTFQSFWGQFGWMGVVMHARIYAGLATLSGWAGLGLLAYLIQRWRRRQPLAPETSRALLLLAIWVIVTTLGYLWWNVRYVQHQGRYLFPALAPLGLAFTWGLREALRLPLRVMLSVVGLGLVALIAYGLLRQDLPAFALIALAASGGALAAGHWLEQRRPGVALALCYLGLAAFAVVCLFCYIVPNLRPL